MARPIYYESKRQNDEYRNVTIEQRRLRSAEAANRVFELIIDEMRPVQRDPKAIAEPERRFF